MSKVCKECGNIVKNEHECSTDSEPSKEYTEMKWFARFMYEGNVAAAEDNGEYMPSFDKCFEMFKEHNDE